MTKGAGDLQIAQIGVGTYRVVTNGRAEVVYVAQSSDGRWAFWNGRVFHFPEAKPLKTRRAASILETGERLVSPMPAKVIKLFVEVGQTVEAGTVLLIVEAMKMEIPLKATRQATVTALHCREGELVAPDTVLVELT